MGHGRYTHDTRVVLLLAHIPHALHWSDSLELCYSSSALPIVKVEWGDSCMMVCVTMYHL